MCIESQNAHCGVDKFDSLAKKRISFTYDIWAMCLVCVLLGGLTLWTILGNGLVLISLLKYPSLRSISNCLIGNLAVSDFMLSLSVLPFSLCNDLLGYWIFGSILCNVWLSLDVLYCTASIWSLVAIAFDRFTATTFPVWYRKQNSSTGRVFIYCTIVWSLSIVICLPPLVGWNGNEFQDPMKQFAQSHSYDNVTHVYQCKLFIQPHYVVYSAFGSFIIPLIIMLALYAQIFAVLRRIGNVHRENRRKLLASSTNHQQLGDNCSAKPEVKESFKRHLKTISGRAFDEKDTAHLKFLDMCSQTSNTLEVDDVTLETDLKSGEINTYSMCSSSNLPAEQTISSGKFLHAKLVCSMVEYSAHEEEKCNGLPSIPSLRRQCSQRMYPADKRETRATKRMALIIFFFVLCWIPFTLMYMTLPFCGKACPNMPYLNMFVIWLGYANSGLNPLLYTIFNKDFRLAFNRLIYCR